MMITREEAMSFIFSDCNPFIVHHEYCITDSKYLHRKSVLEFINTIYDSIGNCSNCIKLNTDKCPIEGYIDRNYATFFCNSYKDK